MLRRDNGHEFLGREFRPCGTFLSGGRYGVDIMCQDIGGPRESAPSSRRRKIKQDAGQDRRTILESEVSWLKKLFGFDHHQRLSRIEERMDNFDEVVAELARDL